jgi:hypothetical protein
MGQGQPANFRETHGVRKAWLVPGTGEGIRGCSILATISCPGCEGGFLSLALRACMASLALRALTFRVVAHNVHSDDILTGLSGATIS